MAKIDIVQCILHPYCGLVAEAKQQSLVLSQGRTQPRMELEPHVQEIPPRVRAELEAVYQAQQSCCLPFTSRSLFCPLFAGKSRL